MQGSKQRNYKPQVTLTGLGISAELTCDNCHRCTKHLQAVKLVLNTLSEAHWGFSLILTGGRRVSRRVNKRLKELAGPQQPRLLSRS